MVQTGRFKPKIPVMIGLGGDMPDLVKLLEQWAVVTAAPIPFAIAVVIAGGLIWLVVGWSYSSVISGKNAQIELQDRQLADYRDKLKGATPEEAKAKIDALEEKVRNTIGDRWEVLTKDESAKLVELVAPLPKRRIQIMYVNYLGKDLARSFADVFEKAGWPGVVFSEGGGLGEGVGTGRGNGIALTLKTAIETATKLKVESFGPTEPDFPGIVFVAVGIKVRH
jgi:hypothetical protein